MEKQKLTEKEIICKKKTVSEEDERLQETKRKLESLQSDLEVEKRREKDILEEDGKIFRGSRYERFIEPVNESLNSSQKELDQVISESLFNVEKQLRKNDEQYRKLERQQLIARDEERK